MNDIVPSFSPSALFTIRLNFQGALNSADLGEFLLSLSRDYKRFTRGRELYVARVEHGSILLCLVDLAGKAASAAHGGLEVIKAAESIRKFVSKVRSLIAAEKRNETTPTAIGNKRAAIGRKSIEAMLKLAADSQSNIEIQYASADGETINIQLSPTEAVRARKRKEIEKQRLQLTRKSSEVIKIDQAVSRLLAAPEEEIESIIRIIVGLGIGEYYLRRLAEELSQQGHYQISARLLAELPPQATEQKLLERRDD